MIWYKHRLFKNEIGLYYLQITQAYHLYSPSLKMIPCSYQLALNLPCIRINLHSLYTKTYGAEPLRTWIKSLSLYIKKYGIETYHILPILSWVMFLPSNDVRVMCDKYLLHVNIFVSLVIGWDKPFLCSCYQSYFDCLVVLMWFLNNYLK